MAKIIFEPGNSSQYKNCTLTYGHFDLVHPGHIRFLRKASNQGNKLFIALMPDTKKGETLNFQFNQIERAEGLSSFDFVDGIIMLKDEDFPLKNCINNIKPNLLLLGTEYENSKEEEILKAIKAMRYLGKTIQFHGGEIQYASTKLLENPKDILLNENKIKFKSACQKQNLNLKNLIDCINSWKKTRMLVIGDTILDQYAGCEALGMSAEAPVLVVKELQTKNFNGGAAIVASHIKALGANCEFLSVIGNDENGNHVEKKLKHEKITCHLIRDQSRPTTFKKRYVVDNQKLFRVSKLNDHFLDKAIEEKLISKLEKIAPNVNGIIISDFVYGVVTENLIKKVIELSKKYKLKIFGDLQCSSQLGMVTKFKGFNLISPNEKEARIALQDNESGLESISMQLLKNTKTKNLIMKLGADGLIAYEKISSNKIRRQSFPALSVNPVDVSGAGDALLALMATSLCSNNNFMSAASLGICMSAIAVENMGNRPIDYLSVKNFITQIFNNE